MHSLFFLFLVAAALAIQCSDVTKCATCFDTIDDSGQACHWCTDGDACFSQLRPCTKMDPCPTGGGGGSGSTSAGETAGIIVGVLVSVFCVCACVCGIIALVIAFAAWIVATRSP